MFDREAPFELRIQDPGQGPQEVGTLEAIRIKVLLYVSDHSRIKQVNPFFGCAARGWSKLD